MVRITADQGQLIDSYVQGFEAHFNASFISVLQNKISYFQFTQEIENVFNSLKSLLEIIRQSQSGSSIELPDDIIPCLKRVLLATRRDDATRYEDAKLTTIHPEIINKLESKLKPLDEMINQTWLRQVEPMKMPALADYLSIQRIEEHWRTHGLTPVREYDEKFHILQAPGQFLSDLDNFRWKCDIRGTSVVVAHIDIDDFKRFNSKYGHVEVDRRILPGLMRVFETHIFSHGYAYRYGGDEYALLLPNIDYDLAGRFLNLLRMKVEELQYQGINDKATASIGFCYLDSDSYLTNREAEERANKAMSFAKQQGGKNCVAGFLKTRFDDDSLRVVSPT